MEEFNVPLQLINLQGDGFHLLVEVVIYGERFNLVLDTGASKTALDKDTIELLIDDHSVIQHLPDQHAVGLGTTTMERYMIMIPEFMIGNLVVKAYEVPIFDLSTIKYAYQQLKLPSVIGVLGGDILMEYEALIDYKHLILKLRKA
ncbi:aspartyl protease family protein [Pseudopedobacter sp.]|uniref:aspartyl protease family protein n=1 Tax=Pseudopedobacter sp. TaxID=1936787 RepID=UPI003341DA33